MEVTIASLSHDGRGITTIDGKKTFISGALPGEKIICKITKRHPRYNEADVLEIIQTVPERVVPECIHTDICGGCSMQHIAADAQVEFKQTVLLEQLKHFGRVTPETLLAPLSGNPWGYRRKARLGARYVIKKEKIFVGFREKSGRYLADLKSCAVLHPSIGMRLVELNNIISSLSVFNDIPQIEIAVSDKITALIFRHMVDLPESDIKKLCDFGNNYNFHIYLQPNQPKEIYQIWPENNVELLSYSLPEYQLELFFQPLDFTQVNGELNQQLIKQALHLLDLKPTDHVLDLFCGLGNFTLPISRYAKHVTGVEGSYPMVERARKNAQYNQINNTDFHAANLMDPADNMSWIKKQYDKILLDPPRTGAKEILPFFEKFSAKRIVYVSCNPATLARDAGELVHKLGYTLKQVGVINMFPHTSHIEAIAVFEHGHTKTKV